MNTTKIDMYQIVPIQNVWQHKGISISKRNKNILKDKSSNSLMALGAMEVHLNMALQALNVFNKESQD